MHIIIFATIFHIHPDNSLRIKSSMHELSGKIGGSLFFIYLILTLKQKHRKKKKEERKNL